MTLQRNYFSTLFYIRKTRLLKNGEAPICLRITMNGQRAEMQIKRSVPLSCWNTSKGCAVGKDSKIMELNRYLDAIKAKLYQIHRTLIEEGMPISSDILLRKFNGISDKPKMLLEIFREHNKKYRELIDKEYVKGTVLRYERTVKYLEEMLLLKYKCKDIPLKEINNAFVLEFEHFIKVNKGCANNATVKYLKNLKKVITLALANKWMTENPFIGMHFHLTKSNRCFLTEEELSKIINKQFDIPRLSLVKDIFVFCCLTGLAFTDVKHLTPDNISCDSNGCWWIRKPREKTDNMCNIPLMDIPRELADKYKEHPDCIKNGVVFPVPSNQKMNAYLKEIADICGISKPLTTHIARHTFSCLAIANKVSIEVIAKMLGHSDIRTTKIYARLMDNTIAEEMEVMRRKFRC